MRPTISLITLGVRDFNRSLAFYRDTLGWETTATEDDPVAFFQLQNLIFGIFPKSELAKDAGVHNDGNGFPGFSLAQNLASETEVNAAFTKLKAKGVTIMKEPQKAEWGGYSGYFSDPDGYLWELAWNPFWKMDENGQVTI